MRSLIFSLFLLIMMLPVAAQRPYVLTGVHVIDVSKGQVLRNVHVFINHDTITNIQKGKLKSATGDSCCRWL